MEIVDYLVVERRGEWWIVLDGIRMGPYASRDEAINGAIFEAGLAEREGKNVTVTLDDPNDGIPIVYKSPGTD